MRRLLVVSHPAVLAVNQLPYAALRDYGWDPFLVVPAAWRHKYAAAAFPPEVLPELRGRVVGRRVLLPGKVQRHVYLTLPGRLVAELRPEVAFLEAEPTSVPALQWSEFLLRARVPFGLACDENLDRPLPLLARVFRRRTLANAAFVAARSPTAAELVHRFRPDVPAPLIPHHVPAWNVDPTPARGGFVVGYAGRLVAEKGLEVLIDAARGIDGIAVRFVGNGPLCAELQVRASSAGVDLQIDTTIKHEGMAAAYAGFDALVLPSRTTPTWAEQFGRVLVEAMSCGVPVVGSDSGEIPWVINSTGGGLVFPNGDARALREALLRLREDPSLRRELAERGRERVEEQFSVAAVARRMDVALRAAAGLSAFDDAKTAAIEPARASSS
ncbi:MAG: glycosyltransferase family 4 protein [Solirubrobacteraceae bacterium]